MTKAIENTNNFLRKLPDLSIFDNQFTVIV